MITLTILLIITLLCILVGCLMGLFSLVGVIASLIAGVLVGALAGYVAGRFMGTETSLGRNILMGILGSFVGEFVFGLVGIHATGSITGVYEYGCELFKKRMECAIMIKVAENQELAAQGIEVPIELGSTCNACADGEACE